MRSNTNVAYDLSVFEPVRKEESQRQIKRLPSKKKETVSVFKVIVVLLLIIGATTTLLYSRVQLTETTRALSIANAENDVLKSESVRLQTKVENKLSLSNIEQIALSELGMVKLEKSQINYFKSNNQNKIEVNEADENTVVASIKEWFNQIKEYIVK